MTTNTLARVTLATALSLIATLGWAAGPISVIDPYARAVPPVVPNSAAFMTLKNDGETDRELVSASSPAAKTVELHTHINDEGVMRMRQVASIAIPAGGEAKLQPGGLHVMLIGLHQPLEPGDMLSMELTFDDGSSAQIELPVRKIEMSQMHHHHH